MKPIKPILKSLLATIVLALSALSLQAQFSYSVANGTLTITGYSGPGGAVVIPSAVNGVPVTTIGESAFTQCLSLTNITISNSVTNIAAWAFDDCTSLAAVTFGSGVNSIGDDAFAACTGLTSVTIPNSVTSIGEGAFDGCFRLTSILIGDSVTSIGDSAFGSCPLASVTIGDSVISIGAGAFGDCNLTSVTIPKSVTSIGERAFMGCTYLTSVYFQGNSPSADPTVFDADDYATLYYLPGTTGWGPFFANRPAVLWNPQVQPSSFGVRSNQFGFTIAGSAGLVIVVEACTNLGNPIWYPLQTNTLTSTSFYFNDPQWTNYGSRFYRLRWP